MPGSLSSGELVSGRVALALLALARAVRRVGARVLLLGVAAFGDVGVAGVLFGLHAPGGTRQSALPRDTVARVFVLLLTYTRPLAEVDALMREHMAWLNEQYDAGRFLVSGRQIPRTGGVILARGDDREEIEALAATDPFVAGGVATCEVVEFRASQVAEGLRPLL